MVNSTIPTWDPNTLQHYNKTWMQINILGFVSRNTYYNIFQIWNCLEKNQQVESRCEITKNG